MLKISIIGYGKLASLLVDKINEIDAIHINQILVRNTFPTKSLLPFISKFEELSPDIDLLLLAVQDKHIEFVAQRIPFRHIPIVHTSGTVASAVLHKFHHYGVWYPVQTFGTRTDLDWDTLPVCLLSSDDTIKFLLRDFTELLGCHGHNIEEHQRQFLHLAAVFANNFTNHLLFHSESILQIGGLDKSLLMPILQQTIQNFPYLSPLDTQTGPAVREDFFTMEKHLNLLQSLSMDDATILYKAISDSIIHSKP